MVKQVCTVLTSGDTYYFGIICSIDQVLGLSVRQFIQFDICCFLINNQPVVIITDFCIPERMKNCTCEDKNISHSYKVHQSERQGDTSIQLLLSLERQMYKWTLEMRPYLTLVAVFNVSLSIAA